MLNVTLGYDMPTNKTEMNGLEPTRTADWHFRDVVKNLSPNAGADLLIYARKKQGILSLAQGESDWTTPDFIQHATTKAMSEGRVFYGPPLGIPELRQEIANYYARHYGLNLPTNRIFATGSGTTAMHLALTAVLNAGDDVVAVTPIWKNLLGAVEIAQGRIIDVALKNDEQKGWVLDIDELFAAVTPKTQALLIVSPSNPTGWVMPAEDVKRVLDFARERDLWIISDEVYTRTTYEADRAPSFLDFADEHDKLFVVNSFSKLWAMTGWRLGWLVAPAKAEEIIQRIAIYDNLCPNSFVQWGGIEALRHGEEFIKAQKDMWLRGLDLVMNRFDKMGRVRMKRPQSTFYGFFQVDGEPDCAAFAKRLIDDVQLSIAPGIAFGKCCKGYLRICFGVSETKLNDALDRLERALKA